MKYFLGFTPVSFRVMMFAFTIFSYFPSISGIKTREKTNKQNKKQYTYCIRVPTLTTKNMISEPKDNVSQYFLQNVPKIEPQKCTTVHPQNSLHSTLVPISSIKRSSDWSWLPLHSLNVSPLYLFRFKIMDGFCLQLINTYTLKCAYISSYKQYITLCQVIWKMYKTWMFVSQNICHW